MRKLVLLLLVLALPVLPGRAQEASAPAENADTPKIITLEQAIQTALSENASVRVADMEIRRTGYARRGSYASLFPQIDGSASYQRTIKKQVMYMDFDMGAFGGGAGAGAGGGEAEGGENVPSVQSASGSRASGGGIEVGRWNTWSGGVSASMPLVNAQLWKSLSISDMDVELAVEKARSSRLEAVNQVKQAYYACLLARETFEVYKSVYENALANLEQIQRKYNVQKASELDLVRAKTNLANAIPNVYNAESSVILSLWQLKAVMGVSLDENIDVAGSISDYAVDMTFSQVAQGEVTLENNSTLRQLALQAEELAAAVKMQQYSALPSLAVAFNYSFNSMNNDFNFSEYKWTPYSFVGLSLSIPIFAGGRRYNAIRQARVQADELAVQKENTERQLRIALRQYLNQMETATKTYAAAESALESAQKAYDIAVQSYNVGRSTLTDLNDAQLALTQTRLNASSAMYNYLVAKSGLESTIGADFTE